jgi:hypothetical protein
MSFVQYLLDLDLVINLFLLFNKKLAWKDALILTAVTSAIFYVYVTYKNKENENS